MTGEKKVSKDKDVIFKINNKDYSYKIIKIRSKFAPMREIDLMRIRGKNSVGIPEIDSAEIRVCKIGKTFHLITGYNKLTELTAEVDKSTICLMSVKVMAESYLESALVGDWIAVASSPVLVTPSGMRKPSTAPNVLSDTNIKINKVKGLTVPNKVPKEHKKKVVEASVAPAQRIDNSVMKDKFESAGFKVR